MEQSIEEWMQHCLALAEIALQNGNPPVGSIVIFGNRIIGKGIESAKSTGDVTDHAEILAIREAINNGHAANLNKAKLFSTHEPCIMCSYAIRHYKLPHIIYGASVPSVGGASSSFNILSAKDVPNWSINPVITEGICKRECDELSKRFIQKFKKTD